MLLQFIFDQILRWLNSLLPGDKAPGPVEHLPDGHPDTTPARVTPKAKPPEKKAVLFPGGDDVLKGFFRRKR